MTVGCITFNQNDGTVMLFAAPCGSLTFFFQGENLSLSLSHSIHLVECAHLLVTPNL